MERGPENAEAIRSWRGEQGQAIVLSVVWLVVMLGTAGFVIDVGSWYQTQRHMQAAADAAVLAGAASLPRDTQAAAAGAEQYAEKNGTSIPTGGTTISSAVAPNDTISVKLGRRAPTFFTQIFGISSVQVDAHATAVSELMGSARYVAPIVVSKFHPMLSGNNCPCFDEKTSIPLGPNGAPGAFGLLNLDGSRGGNGGPNTLSDWLLNGYPGYLGLGDYYSNTGAKFNSSQLQDALTRRIGTILLFPVYDTLIGNGANAQYDVIGWVGFHLDSFDARGNSGTIDGYFTSVTWSGLAASGNSGEPDYGAHTIRLSQ